MICAHAVQYMSHESRYLRLTTGLPFSFFRPQTFFSDAKIKSSMAKENSSEISVAPLPTKLPHLLGART
jgi:hypothetical protein